MKREGTKVVTSEVRASYAHVFVPSAMEEGQKKKYSVSLIVPKEDEELVSLIEEAIEEAKTLGKAKLGKIIPSKFKNPLRDGDEERPDDDNYAGCYFINANSDRRPTILDRSGKQIMTTEIFEELTRNRTEKEINELAAKRSSEEFYSGVYCMASINFYAFSVSGNKGVACGLNHLMKTRDGENLGGGVSSAADDFGEEIEDSFMD